MNESEVRKLFFKIENRYAGFSYDDYKVEEWRDLLSEIPFELAKENLNIYTLNPENKFPPHPGKLAEKIEQSTKQVKNIEETISMLDKHDELAPQAIPMPAYVKAMVNQLARKL